MMDQKRESDSKSSLVVYTKEAANVCYGRAKSPQKKKYAPPSAFSFGLNMNKIWYYSLNNDPYAELALIRIEGKLRTAYTKIAQYDEILQRNRERWKQPEGLTIGTTDVRQKECIELDEHFFKTVHAKQLLVLIARFDSLMMRLITYRQFGIINTKRLNKIRYRAIGYIMQILHESRTYRKTGITRQDIIARTEKGKIVLKKFGRPPLSILSREQRSEFGPKPL